MSYKKNIFTLMTGATVAQAIPILISPILTRLYSPQEFGILALYLSLSALLTVFAAGRFDVALIEPADDTTARGLLFASLKINIIFCISISGILMLVSNSIAEWFGQPNAALWIKLVPLTVFSSTCLSIFTYWLNRRKNFKGMNTSRILNAIGISSLSLGLAFTNLHVYGLLLGYAVGQLLTVSYQWIKYIKPETLVTRTKFWVVTKDYIRYPKFLIPSTLAGTVAGESPVLLLTRFFDASVAGLFAFVNRVTVSPMSIIGNSIGEVYRVNAAEQYQKNSECLKLFLKHVTVLFLIGLIPWLILFLFSPPLFAFFFGEQWRAAGEIATILSFVIWFQLVSTPLSYTITFNHSQNLDFYLQIFRLIGSLTSMFIGYFYNDYLLGIKLLAMTYCTYYIAHTFIQYRAAKGTK